MESININNNSNNDVASKGSRDVIDESLYEQGLNKSVFYGQKPRVSPTGNNSSFLSCLFKLD